MSKPIPIENRFWDKVDKTGDCWLWTGGFYSNGYGMASINRKPRVASRVSYELTHGPIPKGQLVCHKCDNPACVKPDHLFLGSQSDNMRDCFAKGRGSKPPHSGHGENARNAKLSMEQVRKIRQKHQEGISTSQLARDYKMGWTSIDRIIKHETYKEVQEI